MLFESVTRPSKSAMTHSKRLVPLGRARKHNDPEARGRERFYRAGCGSRRDEEKSLGEE